MRQGLSGLRRGRRRLGRRPFLQVEKLHLSTLKYRVKIVFALLFSRKILFL
jgi:hypothetical protein